MRTIAIVPAFWSSNSLSLVSHFARLVFIGLIAMSDECGNVPDNPTRISALLFPYDSVPEQTIKLALTELQEAGCIIYRQPVDGSVGTWVVVNARHYQRQAAREIKLRTRPSDPELPGLEITHKFRRPSLEEIHQYGKVMGLPARECDAFFHYYESVGWTVGKSRKPMRNWQAALANWKHMTDARMQSAPQQRLRPSDELRLIQEELARLSDQLRVEMNPQKRFSFLVRRRELTRRLETLKANATTPNEAQRQPRIAR